MPNLTEASVTKAHFVRDPRPAPGHVPTPVYSVDISSTWAVGSVAHGGYLLCVLNDAVLRHQQHTGSSHHDPAHVSTQYLTATVAGKAQVEIRLVSATKRWTRLDVELWQVSPDPSSTEFISGKNVRTLRIRAHYLVTALPPHPPPGAPTPHGQGVINYLERPCPLLEHPGDIDMRDGGSEIPAKLRFHKGMKWKVVRSVEPNDGCLAWGAWLELTGGENVAELSTLVPFFADVAKNGPEMLPEEMKGGPAWYPTMSLSLDYKSKFPLESTFATRTFGLYSTTKSIHEGRHDLTVEVWAGPADLGARKAEERERDQGADGVERWRREGARLVGVSTQMALATPLEVNLARGRAATSAGTNGSPGSTGTPKKPHL
ncbi:uncharacterized protein JCM10292_005605 [Rhodotorula paludigena]|uniref:uncharacterized protein n=1 Tax=Rhodotorula paludigena TaxID=86838 RepID=UPI0031828FF1